MSPERAEPRVEVRLGSRTLSLSNLDKVLWPETGFTKGQMVDYYARIAEVLVPHLQARPVTLRRWPDGVYGPSFFEKNCPSHRPPWVRSVQLGDVSYCVLDEPAAVVWVANLASIELHPSLARAPELDCPTAVVFDLDPGPPAGLLECARVAVLLRDLLGHAGLRLWPKTSGGKGLQVYLPLNSGVTYERAKPFARAVAQLVEREHPGLAVSSMDRRKRRGKVMIDWSQNTKSKTTVSVYSLRAQPTPLVSTPVTWHEVEEAIAAGDADRLRFGAEEVLQRVELHGDLHQPVLEERQELPAT